MINSNNHKSISFLLLILTTTTCIVAQNPSVVLTLRFYKDYNPDFNTIINVTSLATGKVIRSGLVNQEAITTLNSVDPDAVNILVNQDSNWTIVSFNYVTLESQQIGGLDVEDKEFGLWESAFGYEPSLQLVMNVYVDTSSNETYFVNWDFKNSSLNLIPLDLGVSTDASIGCYDGKSNYYILFRTELGNSWRITSYDVFGDGLYEMLEYHNFDSVFVGVPYTDSQGQQLYAVEITSYPNRTVSYELYAIDFDSNTASVTMLHQVFSTLIYDYTDPVVYNSQSIVFYSTTILQPLLIYLIYKRPSIQPTQNII
ncbi:hypothetical protein PPL_06662 [Heterostelium album PN500]|uniref:Uncharacterized protein n=1 Tax=Heterostelium pallidum (strain ATCC 26659 / Pp 5 / PN500) TaxID=670386 RepID=D3BFC9_HETP5|nr:hypothetical protein PPL_06662 [Heterostelium album PN500]EFA79843.1 hypothetical protein PPL_06662 [Heterostelium album PN500]|eukprot:XP_020431964.1 hypothetical protein PPL_06662 [Heterostelium album PN500]